MHFLDQRIAGIIILLLWAMLVVAKARATGSLLKDKPPGGVRMWLAHVFDFLFLRDVRLARRHMGSSQVHRVPDEPVWAARNQPVWERDLRKETICSKRSR